MTMILPEDISERISSFISGGIDFPFIKKGELISVLYLYGKNEKAINHTEKILAVAEKTVERLEHSIQTYRNAPKSIFDSEFSRNNYIRRQLQITVDHNDKTDNDASHILNRRIITDPVILSECFSQHVAYHNQKHSFFIYGPLMENELTHDLRNLLSGKIVMLGYNKEQDELPFDHPILPLYIWAKENLAQKK